MMVRKIANILRENGMLVELRIYAEVEEVVEVETRNGEIEEIVFIEETPCHSVTPLDFDACEKEINAEIEEKKKIIDGWIRLIHTLKNRGYLFEVEDRDP
ncbi:MAG: hypothetical protein QXZ14_11200 [Candidatus Jordarchaeales archaeon]|nr:hypothetical protein [Candidatus Jordarchaeia archaeon]